MSSITDALTALGNSLSIVGVPASASAGQPITAGLAPPITPLSITEIVDQPVSLGFLAKSVDFSDVNFAAPGWLSDDTIKRLPAQIDLTKIPPIGDATVVPGLIGQLTGNLPIAVPSVAMPTLVVQWLVKDGAGNVLADGSDFVSSGGLKQAILTLTFLPAFVDFTGTLVQFATRTIEADVTLSIGGDSVTVTVGPVSLQIPAIPVPRLLALTVDANFSGAALILVPAASPLTSLSQLRGLLVPVQNALSTLTAIAEFADMLLGINTLVSILNAAHIEFRSGDKFDNLNDITLISRPWYENDTEAEDELSSFVYLSAPPVRGGSPNSVELFNLRDCDEGDGAFTVTTGSAMVVLCANLKPNPPAIVPSAPPIGGSLVVVKKPNGWNWMLAHSISSFNDELSSVKFDVPV